jgi:hypothetical protein
MKPQPTAWRTVYDERDGFRADLPGEVARTFNTLFGGPDDGQTPGTALYTCKHGPTLIYYISVTRLMFDIAGTVEDFLETAVNEYVGTIQESVLLSERPETFKGLPIRRFQIAARGSVAITGMAVARGRVLYMLSAVCPKGQPHEFDRLCGAFEVL